MSRPFMPLYVADYLSATEHLDAAQTGAYLHLIMHYWQKKCLPSDDRLLARIAKMTPRQWADSKAILQAFFFDGWRHARIDSEILKADSKSQARATSGKQGGISKSLKYKRPPLAKATILPEQTPGEPLPSSSGLGLERKERGISNEIPEGDSKVLTIDAAFDRLRGVYPRRAGTDPPKPARKNFEALVKRGVDPEKIISSAAGYSKYSEVENRPQFVKQLQFWLSGDCWKEDWGSKPSAQTSNSNGGSNGTYREGGPASRGKGFTELAFDYAHEAAGGRAPGDRGS
jgi:uncharacterized protein YdaU (DUF1376 family)